MKSKILIVEDSPSCQKMANESLKRVGDLKFATSLKEARDFFQFQSVDLLILDLHLPDGDGLEFLGELQTTLYKPNLSVIVLSGDSNITKKVTAFSNGAHDYLVKPYSPLELKARVERTLKLNSIQDVIYNDQLGISIDISKYKVYLERGIQQSELLLTPHEFKILFLFLKKLDQIFSRQQIIDQVWGNDVFITPRTVDTHISTLRKKLSSIPLEIISIRSEGYKAVII